MRSDGKRDLENENHFNASQELKSDIIKYRKQSLTEDFVLNQSDKIPQVID